MEKFTTKSKSGFHKKDNNHGPLAHPHRPSKKLYDDVARNLQNKAFKPRRRYLPASWEDGLENYLLRNYRPTHGAAKVNDAWSLARLFGDDVAELAEIYNHARGQMKPNLFQKTGLRAAYISHYFTLNAAKTFVIMEEMRVLLQALIDQLPADNKVVRILDLGCGPGSCGLATAQVLLGMLPAGGKVQVDFVDKAPQLLDDIKPLAKELGLTADESPRVIIRTFRGDILKDAPKTEGGYHLILMANILNEVWGGSWRSGMEEKAANLFNTLSTRLAENLGFITVLEPATKECTTTLLAFREALRENCYTLAPCLHDGSCHLFTTGGQDWCHSERAWQRPNIIEELDHVTKLDHSLLRWSYWVFTPWSDTALTKIVDKVRLCPRIARLVSGFIPVAKGHYYKLQYCTPRELELGQIKESNPTLLLEEASFGTCLGYTSAPEKSDYPRRGVIRYGKSNLEPKKES